jgi:hypothetical protein
LERLRLASRAISKRSSSE